MAFRSKPSFTSSRPRMVMFGVTTFMFVLGIIALVLETALGFQQMRLFLDPSASNVWSSYHTNIIIAVGATITRLMVRSYTVRCLTQLTKGYSVYSQRYYMCLACGGTLEQRQTRHCHSSALHPWDDRYINAIPPNRHSVLIWN